MRSFAIASLLIAGLFLPTSLHGQSIQGLSVPFTSPGVPFTIEGEGFGIAKPTVRLESLEHGGFVKAQVLSWGPTAIECRIKKAKAGQNQIWVRPKGLSSLTASVAVIEVMKPLGADELGGTTTHDAGSQYLVEGAFFGAFKGKVRIGGKLAKVYGGTWTDQSVLVQIPKSLKTGVYSVTLQSSVGKSHLTEIHVKGSGGSAGKEVLPVTFVPQYTSVWCWAACSEMVLSYYGNPTSQCYIVDYWSGKPFGWCCSGGFGCMGTAPTMGFISSVLLYGGVQSYTYNGPLSFSAIKAEIDHNRPIILGYQSAQAGHVVVLYGYDAANGTVNIMDPIYGRQVSVPYGTSFVYNGTMIWTSTIAGIHKL